MLNYLSTHLFARSAIPFSSSLSISAIYTTATLSTTTTSSLLRSAITTSINTKQLLSTKPRKSSTMDSGPAAIPLQAAAANNAALPPSPSPLASVPLASAAPQRVVLPEPGKKNILITSALPYVNNVPHLGNLVGCVLSADAFARFCRLRGEKVIYICGTDEYGTATEVKAVKEGLTPREICDKYNKLHEMVYKWFDISFDHFGRTSTDAQTAITQDIFKKIRSNDYLTSDSLTQFYCEKCPRFLADRFVQGTCPLCKAEGARGDQCDKCSGTYEAEKLIEPRCTVCGTQPVMRESRHLFLDLAKLNQPLKTWADAAMVEGDWTPIAQAITHDWIDKRGLQPRCITRDLRWGTPLPDDVEEQYRGKVFYGWFDAPIGYPSITATYTDQWELWWKNPRDVRLYQFMAKDNVYFHAILFPASQLATGDPWTLVHHLSAVEYLNYENEKFSKSLGVGVFGDHAIETGIPAEVWRFYLLANRPELSDSFFLWDDFAAKNNNELANNVGNLIQRIVAFAQKSFGGVVPVAGELTDVDREFFTKVNAELVHYVTALEAVHIKEGLKCAMEVSRLSNGFWQDQKPWVLAKENIARCGTVVAILLNAVKLISIIFEPFIPQFSSKLLAQLNAPAALLPPAFSLDLLPAGHALNPNEPVVLFPKIAPSVVTEFKRRFSGQQVEDFPLDLRVGAILEARNHPSADALLVLKVDLGNNDTRDVVAGIKAAYSTEELVNRRVVLLCNLKTANFKGVASQAMLVVGDTAAAPGAAAPGAAAPAAPAAPSAAAPAADGNNIGVLFVPDAPIGSIVQPVSGFKRVIGSQKLDYQREFLKMDLKVAGGQVLYKGTVLVAAATKQSVAVDKGVENGRIR